MSPLCSKNRNNLFLQCQGIKRICATVSQVFKTKLTLPTNYQHDFATNMSLIKNLNKERDFNILVLSWWAIWFKRNKEIFDDQAFNERETVELIINVIMNGLI